MPGGGPRRWPDCTFHLTFQYTNRDRSVRVRVCVLTSTKKIAFLPRNLARKFWSFDIFYRPRKMSFFVQNRLICRFLCDASLQWKTVRSRKLDFRPRQPALPSASTGSPFSFALPAPIPWTTCPIPFPSGWTFKKVFPKILNSFSYIKLQIEGTDGTTSWHFPPQFTNLQVLTIKKYSNIVNFILDTLVAIFHI